MTTKLTPSSRPLFAELSGDIAVSFEFFPPKNAAMEQTLWESVTKLAPLAPRFVSVTYGAGGSTRERTHATLTRIVQETGLTAAAHLTCVAATRAQVDAVAQAYWAAGVRHIVALRGDMPGGIDEPYAPHPDGYSSTAELVTGLRAIAPFEISVAAYPECHPDSANRLADIDTLKRKIDAGATRAITQFFFDPDDYFRFLDLAHAAGITAPIVPGILPVSNFAQVQTFAKACGAKVPSWMGPLFDGLDEDPATRQLIAASVAAEQCARLYQRGVREFHFYTLNRSELTMAVCRLLGVAPVRALQKEDAA